MSGKEFGYTEQFAGRYIKTLGYSYTSAKNALVSQEVFRQTPQTGTILDIGGNINALVRNNSMRQRIEELSHRSGKKVHYYVMDVAPAYFNIDGVLEPVLQEIAPDWYKGQIPGIVGDAHQLPFEKESTDTVIMSDSLEHMDDAKEVLKGVNRILRPDGQLLLVLPAMYMLDQFPDRAVDRKTQTSHVNFFNSQTINDLLKSTGYETQDVKGVDYVGGFLYLLYTNNKYVIRRNPKTRRIATREAMKFKDLRDTYRNGSFNLTAIDNLLNEPYIFDTFMSQVRNGEKHPLSIIYDALKLDPAFDSSEELQNTQNHMREIVESVQGDFDPANLLALINSIPPQHTANSVFVRAKKAATAYSPPSV